MLKRTILTVITILGALMTDASAPGPPADPSPATANRLAGEKSPYLLQHANNPVDWYPWGDEAFKKAAREDKPIFLSIGYATCHWCHVMEHESFEDPVVAALMNEAFVNIKVDREERPDIDQVYMTVCQMLTGSGGWPLTILMTPDKQPFFAGTYLPRESRYGRIGMLELVPQVQQLWESDRAKILESTEKILGHLQTATDRMVKGEIKASLAKAAYQQLGGRYDAAEGGFGDRPKFPSPHNLIFLLQYWALSGEERALQMVERTLEAMRLGGIYDHVGFGFHRYSTDAEWLVPHFEKMLYDQAMLTLAYTEAYMATAKPSYQRTVSEILAYVTRDMRSPEGAFYSAEDADSEGEEGLFYLWTTDELRKILSDDEADFALDVWNMTAEGNYLDESTRKATGTNIAHLQETHAEAAERLKLESDAFAKLFETARRTLFEVREDRIHPLKDDKVLTDWNGLMAAAMARAGRVFGEASYIDAARAAVDFVLNTMRSTDGRLMHRYRDGEVAVPGFLDDYVFLTWACLELYDATLEPSYLGKAVELQNETIERFWDPKSGGLFFTAADNEKLLVRQKEVYDGAMPSGNSVAAANLIRLGRLTGRNEFTAQAHKLIEAFAGELNRGPSAHTHMMAAIQAAAAQSIEVVIAGDPDSELTEELLNVVRARYLPQAVVLLVPDGESGNAIRALAPFTENYSSIEGATAAYVCRDFACKMPTSDPSKLAALLRDAKSGVRPDSGVTP